jgi:hypothetical protein
MRVLEYWDRCGNQTGSSGVYYECSLAKEHLGVHMGYRNHDLDGELTYVWGKPDDSQKIPQAKQPRCRALVTKAADNGDSKTYNCSLNRHDHTIHIAFHHHNAPNGYRVYSWEDARETQSI